MLVNTKGTNQYSPVEKSPQGSGKSRGRRYIK